MSMLVNPVGIFWDIENCRVPANKNALHVVKRLRDKFSSYGKEVEFVCVCDVTREHAKLIEKLNAAQVTVIHVSSMSKNAADEKLKAYLRKFFNTYRAPGTLVLITSDIDFSPELTELRYRCGFNIVLIHNRQISDALIMIAHEKYLWDVDFLDHIPSSTVVTTNFKVKLRMKTHLRNSVNGRCSPVDVRVDNLDSMVPIRLLKQNLYSMFSAVVRVLHVTIVPQSEGGWFALVQVASKSDALEAMHRLDKTKLGQSCVVVSISPSTSPNSPAANDLLKRQVQSILGNVVSKSLPLEKFLEIFEEKYCHGITITDLKNMEDVVKIAATARGMRCFLVTNDNHNRNSHYNNPTSHHSNETTVNSDIVVTPTRRTNHSSLERGRRPRFCYCSKPFVSNSGPVSRTPKLLCCIFRDQLITVLNHQKNQCTPLADLHRCYQEVFGLPLFLTDYGYKDVYDMLTDMEGVIQKFESEDTIFIKLRETLHYQATMEQILHIFLYGPDKELTLREFQNEFRDEFGFELPIKSLNCSISDVIEVFEGRNQILGVRLTPVQKFALRVRRLLLNYNGDVLLSDLERAYLTEYGEPIRSQVYGFPNLIGLLRAASHVLYLKGRGQLLTVCINRNFLGFEMKRRRSVSSTPSMKVSTELNVNHSPLATSSDHASEASNACSTIEADSTKIDKNNFDDMGPFTKFLQNTFFLDRSLNRNNLDGGDAGSGCENSTADCLVGGGDNEKSRLSRDESSDLATKNIFSCSSSPNVSHSGGLGAGDCPLVTGSSSNSILSSGFCEKTKQPIEKEEAPEKEGDEDFLTIIKNQCQIDELKRQSPSPQKEEKAVKKRRSRLAAKFSCLDVV